MVASENGALRSGKVGGLADVVRDLPHSLAATGCEVTVITPSYGILHRDNPSRHFGSIDFPFAGKKQSAEILRLEAQRPHELVTHLAIEHPGLRGNPIYYNDPSASPFLRDARKFALFCSAVGQFLCRREHPFVLHLHDWHTGTIFLLRELHQEFRNLRGVRTLFTLHNVAIQGTRQFSGPSSVEEWFPELFKKTDWIEQWRDPQWKEPCFNPMLSGIRLADKVNTVSVGYANEILKPSDHPNGFYGGEGLEKALGVRSREGDLSGILNGCEYPPPKERQPLATAQVLNFLYDEVLSESGKFGTSVAGRIDTVRRLNPTFLLTGVTRIVEQKVRLFFEKGSDGNPAIESIMRLVAGNNGAYIFVGNGLEEYEKMLSEVMQRHEGFIFLNAYSEVISEAVYRGGTLFLMPSSFEPCGISQMIAMREGQPCLVHAVGGLHDTVSNGVNGFSFTGKDLPEQADAVVAAAREAMHMFLKEPVRWDAIRSNALASRFTWTKSAQQYLDLLFPSSS